MTTMRRRSSKRGINRGTQSTSTKRGINRGTQSTSENTSSFDIQKQLSNYKTRLGDASEEATDTRNPIEKALNLKKDQNVLFDIFELLGRPQQALFGAIDAGQKGKDIGKGALKGLTGEKETSGKQLLKNAGMKDRKGKLDVSDVLGFGLDVFADPMDVPLIPVKGVTAAGKVLGKADNVADAARAAGKAADVADAARTATKFISPSEGVFRLAGKGVKGAAKLTDKGVEKVLGRIDAKQLRNVEKVASETGQTTADILKQVGGKSDLLGDYRALKKGISNTLDSSKMVGGLVGETRRSANRADLADAIASAKVKDLRAGTRKVAEDIAQKTGRNADDVMNELSRNLTRYIEFEQDTSIDGAKFLNNLSSKSNKFEGTKESVKAIEDALNTYNKGLLDSSKIKFNVGKDGKSLKINTKNMQMLKNNPDMQKVFSNLNLRKDLGYSEKQLSELGELGKQFGKGGELENLYQTNKKAYNDISDIYKQYTGVDFSDITSREGYLKRARGELIEDGENLGPGFARGSVNTKSFSARKHTAPAEVENIRRQEKIASDIEKTNKNIESATRQLSNNKIAMLESQKEAVEIKKADKLKRYEANLAKVGERQGKLREGLDKVARMRDEVATKLDDKTIKNISKVKDKSIAASISQASTDLNNATKEYNTLVKKLSDTDLAEKELGKLNKQVEKLSSKMESAQLRLNAKIDAVNNFTKNRTDMVLKNAHSAMTKSENIANREAKLTSQLGETLEKTRVLTQSQTDTIEHFDKVINTLDAQIKGINPENDKKILEKIKRLENKKVILASQEGKDLFNLDYYAGLDTFLNQTKETAKGVSIYRDALATSALNNKDYIKFAEDLADGEVPKGFTKVKGDVLSNQFDNIKNFLPDDSDALKTLAEDFKGKTLYLDKDFARLMNVTKNSKEQANALVKVIDSFNNTFKKYKIMTPGFQVRNIAGNATNMVLSGMPAGQIPVYYGKAGSVLNSADDLLEKVSKGVTLTGKDADNWKLLQQFYEGGFKDAGTKLQDLEQLRSKVAGKKGPLNWLTKQNAKINESMDGLNRMALLMYANEHPKYVQKLGKSNAIEAVKYALMDPSNMSDFEKSTMKKIVPFYTFTKQNLLYQASNMMKNTPKYNRLIKAINATYDNLDENSYFQYQKEGMQIPIPFAKDSKGNQLFLKANLPLADLGDFMSNPLQKTLASTSPLIRTPFEMVTGKDIYSGRDSNYNTISNLVESATGKPLSSGVKNATGKAEQILSGLGVDTISTNVLKKVTSAIKKYNGDMDDQAMWAEIFRSILQNTNQEKVEQSKAYDDLERYQSYIKNLKNQGIEVPTIRELNNQSKRTLRNAKNRRAKRNRY